MNKDSYGRYIPNQKELFKLIYSGVDINNCSIIDKDLVNQYNQALSQTFDELNPLQLAENYQSQEDFDKFNQANWYMPNEYKTIDIEGFLVNQCPKQNYQRLIEELREFKSRNMLDLLRWLKYFVDTARNNKIVWGVGRGSSVSSYTLYLLGVHKIDSIKYGLDMKEFFKELNNEKNI